MVCGGKNISHHLVVLAAQALLVQVNLKQKTSFSKGLAYLPSRPLVMDLKWNLKMSSEVDFSINGEKIPQTCCSCSMDKRLEQGAPPSTHPQLKMAYALRVCFSIFRR